MNLGVLFAEGKGVLQDYVEGHKWFNLAAAGGDPRAAQKRRVITSLMAPAQVAEAQKMAREWKASAPGGRIGSSPP